MLPILILSILVHLGQGITGNPNDKCLLINWNVDYDPENHTLLTEIEMPFRENLKCHDYFFVRSFDVLLNANGQTLQAIKLITTFQESYTYTFHNVEPCHSYEIVMIPTPDITYQYTYNYKYEKNIDHDYCTTTIPYQDKNDDYDYKLRQIVEADHDYTDCLSSEALPKLMAEYRPKDGGSVAVWFQTPTPEYEHCFEIFSLSWGINRDMKHSEIVYFQPDEALQKHIFYDMDLYWYADDPWNDCPCKVFDVILEPCYNLSYCLRQRSSYIPDLMIDPSVHVTVNSCMTIENETKDEPEESISVEEEDKLVESSIIDIENEIRCEECNLNINTEYYLSNHSVIVRFQVSDPIFQNCFKKFYIALGHRNIIIRSDEIESKNIDWNTYIFDNVKPCELYDVIITPCYNDTVCMRKNKDALIDANPETCIKPYVCNNAIPNMGMEVDLKNLTIFGSFQLLNLSDCFTSYNVFLIHRKEIIDIKKVFHKSGTSATFSFDVNPTLIGEKKYIKADVIIQPCYNSWLCTEKTFKRKLSIYKLKN